MATVGSTPPWLAPVARSVGVASLGAGAVAGVLWGHGPEGRTCAAVLLVTALAAEGAATFATTLASRLVVMAVATGLAEAMTVAWVGRAPALLALGGTAIADAACWRTDRSPGRATPGPVVLPAAAVALTASVIWAATESLGPTVAAWAAAAVLAVSPRLVGNAQHRIDAVTLRLTGPAATASMALAARLSSMTAAAGRAAGRLLTAGGRTVVAVARRAARAVAACGSWLARADNRPAVVSGVVAALVTTPIFWRIAVDPSVLVRGTNDINSGVPRIEAMSLWPLEVTAAHPGWLALMRVMFEFTSVAVATSLVSAVATGAAVTMLVIWARSRWDDRPAVGWPLAVAVGLGAVVLENPAVLVPTTDDVWGRFPLAGTLGRGTGYLNLHQWATPTIIMSLPLVIGMFVLLQRVIEDARTVGATGRDDPTAVVRRRRLAWLTVVTCLIQPATTLALAPAATLFVLLTERRGAVPALRWLARAYLVPGALVIVGQVVFLRSNVSDYEQATWLWRPFWVWQHLGLARVACWLAVPAFVLPFLAGRRRWAEPSFALPLLGLLVSTPVFLLLEQTTVAAIPDADLGVPVLMAVWLLFWSTLRQLAIDGQALHERRVAAGGGPVPPWAIAAAVVLSVMLAAGVVDLLAATGIVPEI